VLSHVDAEPNGWKLTATEEFTLIKWILFMDKQGLLPRISTVQDMASLLLSSWLKSLSPFSEKWVQQFVNHYSKLKSKYSCRYDHQQALYEDSKIIRKWF